MPRKASCTTQSKANARGGGAMVAGANDGGPLMTSSSNSGAATGNAPVRGVAPTRGVKRRRTSNNVNANAGNDLYGSGTIIASNPFDDDHHMPMPNHTISNVSNNNNKMMIVSPNQPNYQHHPILNMGHHGPAPPHPMLHGHHQPPPPHHQQQMMHQHPQQMYAPQHHHDGLMHQNNHHPPHLYQMQQQPMNMGPPPPHHMGTPPTHMPAGAPMGHLSPHQVNMHPDHHMGTQQNTSSMHNQAGGPHMMPGQPIHQNYALSPAQNHQQQQSLPPMPQQVTNNQQQPQMIGTSTPPIGMSGPAPSNSPYNTMQPQNQMVPPHQTLTPPQQQVSQQGPLTPHLDPMQIQQPPYNNNAYCGKCQREIYQNEQNIICKAGCKSLFHLSCSGLTQLACELLMKESLAEWACDRCTSGARRVPYIKYKT